MITKVFTFSLLFTFAFLLVWSLVSTWYFQLVARLSLQIHHSDGRTIPRQAPKMLVGNLVDVYRAKNRLSAYHGFHEKFGEIVQIFWLWRQQISVTNYQMARRILIYNQKNYEKFTPNSLIQKLYGSSVLTNTGDNWQRHRLLMNEVFSRKHVKGFHDIFVDYSERLAHQWSKRIDQAGENIKLNIYDDLNALFLDIVGKTSMSHDFAALNGEANQFLANIKYILNQSTRPVHQFTKWWQHLPLSSNHKLADAFKYVDNFLNELIEARKNINKQSNSNSSNVLDLLLQATDFFEDNIQPLTDKEVRDNLLAIIVNGHETVATSVSLTLYSLAQHPEILARVQAEIAEVMEKGGGQLTTAGVAELNYLDYVLLESLRLYPPMAGLQRISLNSDVLEGWAIPSQQAVGITFGPLHANPEYFGANPEHFNPDRYLDTEGVPALAGAVVTTKESTPLSFSQECPVKWLHSLAKHDKGRTKAGVCLPLTFGDGARKCLGEHFAMYEMKVALAVLLYRFNLQVAPNFEADLELGKFGLFISMFPKTGIELIVSRRKV
ncbi:MAG: cytochrome P450 [Desmonostoc vinosum HA7617-LM4]|jgi:cytochrome P450|nr:cytochrome P450 [Desmonostoc vinosum HA7617-LM4]